MMKLILNKPAALGIILFLVLGVVLVYPTASSETVDSPFGQWQISVSATGADGSIHSFAIMNNMLGQLLSINYEGQEVTTFTYTLKAGATGNGYDSCELDMSNTVFAAKVDGTDIYIEPGASTVTLDLDGTMQTAFEMTFNADLANHIGLSTGTYNLVFYLFQGNYRFRGMPDGEWQTSSSVPQTTIQIEKTAEEKTCYQCDGEGGYDSTSVPADQSCPSGYQDTCPDCACYTETSYGSWGSWQNTGCVRDCYMGQVHYRDKLERTCCPGGSCTSWVKIGTDDGYRQVVNDVCCEVTDVTCYQCDGSGNVDSQTFTNSCPSGWSYSPPSCGCTTTENTVWGSWYFDHCEGRTRYDIRTGTKVITTCCPGSSCTETSTPVTDERHYISTIACGGMQIITSNLLFTISLGSSFDSYQTDSSHYLGRI